MHASVHRLRVGPDRDLSFEINPKSWHPGLTRETRPVPAFSVHRCRGARGKQGEDVSGAVRHVQGVQEAGERGGGQEETGESQGTILGLNRRTPCRLRDRDTLAPSS